MSIRYLVVDGHSVIYSWPDLRSQHDRNPRLAREALVKLLRTLHDTSEWAVSLIFDGRFGSPAIPDQSGFIVRYSSEGQTADSVIEGLVASQTPSKRELITVITADQAERNVVESLGAACFSPDWLKMEFDNQQTTFSHLKKSIHRQAKW